MDEWKTCKDCKQSFPATTAYFHKCGRYLNPRCKSCSLIYDRQRKGNTPRKAECIGDPRICTKCDKEYPATKEHFPSQKGCLNDLRPECRRCNAIRCKNYNDTHKERHKELNRAWLKANPEKAKRSQRESAQRNAARLYAYRRKYEMENRHIRRGTNARRKARRNSLPCDFLTSDWLYALEFWENTCAVCGRTEDEFTVIVPDHWLALSKGGATIPSNIIPLCHPSKKRGGENHCNTSKNQRDAISWLIERLGEQAAQVKLNEINEYFSVAASRKDKVLR